MAMHCDLLCNSLSWNGLNSVFAYDDRTPVPDTEDGLELLRSFRGGHVMHLTV